MRNMEKSGKNWNLTGKILKNQKFSHIEKNSSIFMYEICFNALKLWTSGPNILGIWKRFKKISMDHQIKAKKAIGGR